MTIQELVSLTQAGYTKADIEALGIPLGSEPAPVPEIPAEAAPEAPAEQPVEQPAPAISDEKIKALETKLDYVISRFNYMAVQNSKQPDVHEESVDDILASVVRGVTGPR